MSKSNPLFTSILASVVVPPALVEEDPTAVVETAQGDETTSGLPAAKQEALAETKTAGISREGIFRASDAHPLALDVLLIERYAADWLGWEIETLARRIREDYHTPTVADVNIEKIQACRALHLVDTYWKQWEVFLHCTTAFTGGVADFHHMAVPTVAECMISADIAQLIRKDVAWSPEVTAYLGVVHRYNSILCSQDPLSFVSVDHADSVVNVADVERRWPAVLASGKPPAGGSIEDVQLQRMLDAHLELETSRRRLRSQLTVLQNAK